MNNNFVVGIGVSSQTLLFAIMFLSGFLALAIIVSMIRIYQKAGKPGISAIIPIWGQIVLFEIVDKPWWYLFLLMVPIVNIVITIQTYILLAKRFGKGTGIGIGMVFLPMIFIPLLSFYDYVGDQSKKQTNEEPIYNPFNKENVEQVMPVEPKLDNVVKVVEPVTANISETTNIEQPLFSSDVNTQQETPILENNPMENVQVANSVIEQATPTNINEIPVMENQQLETNVGKTISVGENNTISSIQVGESVIEQVEPTNMDAIPVVENQNLDTNVKEVNPVISTNISVEENNSEIHQDIQTVLETPNQLEPKNIAFNSTPIIGANLSIDNNAPLETLSTETDTSVVSENSQLETLSGSDNIELPEIATKICPACGTSLADDNKFCTSCGTQI